jgi:hypothetical protein
VPPPSPDVSRFAAEYILRHATWREVRQPAGHPPQAPVVFNMFTWMVALAGKQRPEDHEVARPHRVLPMAKRPLTIHIPDDFQPPQRKTPAWMLLHSVSRAISAGWHPFWPNARMDDSTAAAGFRRSCRCLPTLSIQPSHANVIYPRTFAWLGCGAEIIQAHQTLSWSFIQMKCARIRKPQRAGCRAPSQIAAERGLSFRRYLSPYRLIQRSKFLMVYNSSIDWKPLMGR